MQVCYCSFNHIYSPDSTTSYNICIETEKEVVLLKQHLHYNKSKADREKMLKK